MLGEAASRALRNSTPDPSFGGVRSFFCADTAAGAGLNAAGTGAGSGNGTRRERERERAGERAPGRGQERREASGAEGRGTSAGAGTGAEAIKGAERGQRGRKAAGERAPEVTENDVVRPRKGSIPVRQCPRAACSPATPLRQLPPPLRRDATPSRYPLPPLAPHLCKLPLACTTTRPVSAPLRPLLLSSGRAEEAPRRAGHRLPSPKYAQPTHRPKYTQPTHRPNTHKKRAASAAGCRPMERMRRLYSRSSPVSSATGGS